MDNKHEQYKKLDFSKLVFSNETISTEEALRDITPFPWNKDILDGKRKAIVKRGGRKDVQSR